MNLVAHQIAALRPIALALLAAFALSISAAQALAAETGASSATAPAKRSNVQRVYFATPQEGFDALIAALRKSDDTQLGRLLGPGHAAIVDSGDAAADRDAAAHFVGRLVRKGQGDDLPRGHAVAQQVGHAMRDDPGLAAARTCQNQ